MQTGQQFGGSGEGIRFDSQVQEGNAGSESDSTEGDVILGVVSIGSHDTIGAGGRRCGYVMGLVDLTGKKYYVDISENTYRDIVDVYVAAVRGYEAVDQHTPAPVGKDPTGSPEEIERMKSVLEQTTSTDAMRKLGFISDDGVAQSRTVDPVDDILAMASDESDDYEDPGEESFQEGVEGL